MKALLLSGYKHLRLTDLPTPSPRPSELLVQEASSYVTGQMLLVNGCISTARLAPPYQISPPAKGQP